MFLTTGRFLQAQFRLRQVCVAVCFLCGFMPLWLASQEGAAQDGTAQRPDVRLVIDVSGSMKRNDPNNLRQPAVDLLVRLVPDGGKAGVWTFGKYVNMLVPHQVVDAPWREAASRKSAEINSVGLFTNIGGALETAAHDMAAGDPGYATSVILLTDGMVDISKSSAENEAEWRRVVDQVFPALKQAGYKVHAVALSEEADRNLMEKLAITTGGTFAVAKTADDLMKIFLQAFDLAVPSQKVALVNNRFLVDSSVDEFTALIFRQDHSEQTRLIGPDEVVIQADKLPEDVRWLRTEEYDLITVQQPYEGEWQIVAAIEPESRVTVVSNLALRVKELPSNLFRGNAEQLSFVLQGDGKPIADRTFLNLLESRVSLSFGQTLETIAPDHWSATVPGSAASATGVYEVTLPMFEKMGIYDLRLTVDGKTFSRQYSHRITVREPFSASLEQVADDDGVMRHMLTVRSHSELIDPQQTQIAVTVVNPVRRRLVKPLVPTLQDQWQTPIPFDLPGRYQLTVQVTGTDKRKEPFDYALTPLEHEQAEDTTFAPAEPPPPEPEPPAPPAEAEPAPAEPEQPAPLEEAVEEVPVDDDSALPAWLFYLILGIGNLAILGGGYWLFRKLMTDDNDEVAEVVEELESPAAPAPKSFESDLMTMDAGSDDEPEPPMEDLADEAPDDADDVIPDLDEVVAEDEIANMQRDLVEQVMADATDDSKEDFAAEIRRAQGLDMDESELDEAITTLIDELDGEPRPAASDDLDDFDLDMDDDDRR